MEHGGHRSTRGSRGVPGLQGGFNRVHWLVKHFPFLEFHGESCYGKKGREKISRFDTTDFCVMLFFVPSFDWAYHVERDQCLYIRVVNLRLTCFEYFDCQGRLWFQSFKGSMSDLNAHRKSESCCDHEFLLTYNLYTIHLIQLYPKWWFSKGKSSYFREI